MVFTNHIYAALERLFSMYSTSSYLNQTPTAKEGLQMTTRVLVVDDDSDTIDLLKIILEPNAFEVIPAFNGKDGVERVHSDRPDVIVVDLLMPEMDGLAVCQNIRKFSNTPIVVLSAYDRPGTAEQALQYGADDYLSKPMNSNLLIASLNRLTRRVKAQQRAIYPGGDGNGHRPF